MFGLRTHRLILPSLICLVLERKQCLMLFTSACNTSTIFQTQTLLGTLTGFFGGERSTLPSTGSVKTRLGFHRRSLKYIINFVRSFGRIT